MINNKAEWTEQDKNSLGIEFPNLPYIIDGDFKLTECKAIAVYICDKWCPALMGSNPGERANIIMMQQVLSDQVFSWLMLAFQQDDRQVVIDKCISTFPPIAEHLGSKNFMQGNDITMIDFYMFDLVETILELCQDERIYTTHPALPAFMDRMRALPTLAAYMNSDKMITGLFFNNPALKVKF